jgi:predicted small integral membrane protein
MSVSQNLPNLEIGYSLARLLKVLGAGLLLTLLCAAVAFNWLHGKDISTFQIVACSCGVALFGFATCQAFWRLISSREPVVFISRVGIRDTRVADDTIAWRSVRDILVWQLRTQKIVVLKLDPLVAEQFAGGMLQRVLSLMNKALGADGVIINAGGLTMDAETLFETCKQYWAAGRSTCARRAVPEPEPAN